ncbi:hypothetical protein JHK82_016411 [Glycine max]|uniref:Uncharacterized protein n=2 Tax=Glycine subgen. Soja TaxID=1462606 RepID=A0A0R0JRC0_SOYBN|nr:hypothetical protein JHK87_016350 [Glycine soja]KAG5032844.1 hypothetical protein JHK85_016826 [Glycine max]KAG5047055.1 hypothetical protein JHK86_016461 [Glycine max]KAG5149530.1 hypothetical protein JHK82_016411 [Glycine max]KAH1127482.1 hypothetical protein GYH30_016187 [Glycine max]
MLRILFSFFAPPCPRSFHTLFLPLNPHLLATLFHTHLRLITLLSLLCACVNLAIFNLIKEIHGYALIIIISGPSGVDRDAFITPHYYELHWREKWP